MSFDPIVRRLKTCVTIIYPVASWKSELRKWNSQKQKKRSSVLLYFKGEGLCQIHTFLTKVLLFTHRYPWRNFCFNTFGSYTMVECYFMKIHYRLNSFLRWLLLTKMIGMDFHACHEDRAKLNFLLLNKIELLNILTLIYVLIYNSFNMYVYLQPL